MEKTVNGSVMEFSEKHLEPVDGAKAAKGEVFDAYRSFCERTGLEPLRECVFRCEFAKAFNGDLRDGKTEDRRNAYMGIRLVEMGKTGQVAKQQMEYLVTLQGERLDQRVEKRVKAATSAAALTLVVADPEVIELFEGRFPRVEVSPAYTLENVPLLLGKMRFCPETFSGP